MVSVLSISPFSQYPKKKLLLILFLVFFSRLGYGELTYQIQDNLSYDDHIEFGLSVDPNTSPLAGRQEFQLSGFRHQQKTNAKWLHQITEAWQTELNLNGQRYRYLEAELASTNQKTENNLTIFNGYDYQLSGLINYRFSDHFPPLQFHGQFQRQSRVDVAFDQRQQGLELNWGRVLGYRYQRNWFDDEITKREDFQLVGSQLHQFNCGLRLKFWFKRPAQLTYLLTLQRYQDNLNDLVWWGTGLSQVVTRFDRLHQLMWRQPFQLTDRLIIQMESFYQRNRGNLSFYYFSIAQTNLVTFYRWELGRSIQLTSGGQWLAQPGRPIENGGRFRRDFQWRIEAELRWRFNQRLALIAGYNWAQNQTNETAKRLSFLNYTHNQCQLTITFIN